MRLVNPLPMCADGPRLLLSLSQPPKTCITASRAPRPTRNVPARRAKSFLELATETTVAPANANRRNLKTIGRPNVADGVFL